MADPTAGDETPVKPNPKTPDSQAEALAGGSDLKVKWWLQQIQDARSRERGWRKEAAKAVELYEGAKKKEYQYNVLYSNTEILSPALYNKVPRPVVVRRFRDKDPLGKVAADIVKRALEFFSDSNESEYPDFDEIMRSGVLEALVPGRGFARFKHEVEFCEVEGPAPQQVGQEKPESATVEKQEQVLYETVCGECIPWDRFTHGYAKKWRHVPWIAIDHYMDREELVRNFGQDLGARIELNETEKESEEGSPGEDKWSKKRDDQKGVKLALVHEIWNKVDKTVIFLSPGFTTGYIKQVEDPLEITGFFPGPEPLRLFDKIKTLVPTCLYTMYEEQARELNRLTTRINRVIGAAKVRGMYDKRITGIERLLQQDDNSLLPAENMSQIGDMAKLDQAIWLMPIDKLVAVLQQLYVAREATKGVIYEIMGISDILRGSSKASETLGAQEIKDQWGSLRVSRMQGKVQKYARNCLRVMAEIGVGKLAIETMAKITGVQLPMAAQKQQAQMMVQQYQQAMAMQQMGHQSMPGAPPQQQQPPPPQVQQAMALLQQPAWEDVMGLLRDTLTRSYRIDIETNSTIDPEATDDKAQIVDVMQAMAQMMATFGPLVESGALPMEVVKGILTTVVRRFRFGDELEGYLEQLTTPQQKPDPKLIAAQAQAQHDQAKMQLEMQQFQAKAQMETADDQRKAEFKQQEHALRMQELQMKMQMMVQEHTIKLKEVEVKAQAEIANAALKVQTAHAMPKPGNGSKR